MSNINNKKLQFQFYKMKDSFCKQRFMQGKNPTNMQLQFIKYMTIITEAGSQYWCVYVSMRERDTAVCTDIGPEIAEGSLQAEFQIVVT